MIRDNQPYYAAVWNSLTWTKAIRDDPPAVLSQWEDNRVPWTEVCHFRKHLAGFLKVVLT